jgi:hypothetical protein
VKISGPFLDRIKKTAGQPHCWFLRYSTPKLKADGTIVISGNGKPALQRHRPYYPSKAKAEADKPRLEEQHNATGSSQFIFDRKAVLDYEQALKITNGVPLVDVAKFWRLHHPEKALANCRELFGQYIEVVRRRSASVQKKTSNGNSVLDRHVSDLKSRIKAFVDTPFGDRYPMSITQVEILKYVWEIPGAPRTKRNHKNALSAFFGWMAETGIISKNPAGGIERRQLPREIPKEIEFLTSDQVLDYLRAAERYAPEIVAHEVVQLFSGVRSDDEMADFRAEYVLAGEKSIVIPAAIAKTGKRDVIDGLEDNFWEWWRAYGPLKGPLRPPNYEPRWKRVRVLAHIHDQDLADRLARLPIKTLLARPEVASMLQRWPWNARRRTFCTYHVAKHQNADKTALILRHRGSASTLHDSYRGLGVTKEMGGEYFNVVPSPVKKAILPKVEPKGIVRIQAERNRKHTRSRQHTRARGFIPKAD